MCIRDRIKTVDPVWLQVIKYVKFLSYPPKKGRTEKFVSGTINSKLIW